MKTKMSILVALLVSLSVNSFAQEKYLTKTGHINFFSSTPMENIEADNNQVTSYIDSKSGAIAVQLLMKAFKFERALMEEHFNENYVESSKYPKSEFKGLITNIGEVNFKKDGTYHIEVKGKLTIHGVTNDITEKAVLEVSGEKVILTGKLSASPNNYGISIPDIVKDKIGKDFAVTVDMAYVKFKK